MSLITLLVGLIVLALLWWAIGELIKAFKIQDPIARVIKVVYVIIVVLWLLSAFGLFAQPFRL